MPTIVVFLTAVFILVKIDRIVITKYASNENLKTIKTDWKGAPVDEKGRFVNHEFPFLAQFSKLIKWTLSIDPQREEETRPQDSPF